MKTDFRPGIRKSIEKLTGDDEDGLLDQESENPLKNLLKMVKTDF